MSNILVNYIAHPSVGAFIVPHQSRLHFSSTNEKHYVAAEQMRIALNGEILTPTTQDNLKLDAMYFAGINPTTHQQLLKSDRTVILFCGLGNYHYYSSDLVQKYRNRGFNVAIFNYRGIGKKSEGTPSRDGMILDGLGMVDHIHTHHGVPLNLITAHGFSLGGGPSAAVAAARPGVNAVNERSYSKLSSCSSHFISNIPVVNKIAGIAPLTIRYSGWEFDTEENWKKITGRKCVVYHPNDEVIGKEGSLYKAILGKDPSTTFVEMDPKVSCPHGAHIRLFENVEVDAIVEAIKPRVHAVAIPAIQGLTNIVRPQSCKWRFIQLLRDIFYILLYPLGVYQLFRDLFKI